MTKEETLDTLTGEAAFALFGCLHVALLKPNRNKFHFEEWHSGDAWHVQIPVGNVDTPTTFFIDYEPDKEPGTTTVFHQVTVVARNLPGHEHPVQAIMRYQLPEDGSGLAHFLKTTVEELVTRQLDEDLKMREQALADRVRAAFQNLGLTLAEVRGPYVPTSPSRERGRRTGSAPRGRRTTVEAAPTQRGQRRRNTQTNDASATPTRRRASTSTPSLDAPKRRGPPKTRDQEGTPNPTGNQSDPPRRRGRPPKLA